MNEHPSNDSVFASVEGPPVQIHNTGVIHLHYGCSQTVYVKRGESAEVIGSMSSDLAAYVLRALRVYAAITGEFPNE